MKYIIHTDDIDPAMRYEGLARYAFDCDRCEGPNNIADQKNYHFLFIPKVNSEGFLVINQILDALIKKEEESKADEIREIRDSLNKEMTQQEAINLFDNLIKIIKK